MEEIPGKRANTSRYVHDGYEYHIDTTSVHLFRCSRRATTGCRGTARVDEQGRVDVYRPHEGHGRNETILEESRVRAEMLDLATRTHTPLKEIFDDVCRRNPLVAPKFTFPKMRTPMQRARASVRPVIPESLRELADALEDYEPTRQVYRGIVEGDDGTVALVFTSVELLEALSASAEIYMDGTFKVAPYRPHIAQLYTIHLRFIDTGVAAVYVLCGARTRALYTAIFRRLCDLAPGLAGNLRFAMGDYERAAMGAIREIFPEASLHGCWFHFNQALVRQWRRLGLADARTRILSLAMALPLAPADRFNEGLGLLAEMADEIAEEHPAILRFMSYMRRQWSPLADVVSVHGCPLRTNNLVESFHNEAKRKLGGLHPNIWKFIEHLTDLIGSQGMDLARIDGGELVRRARTARNMGLDTLICNAQHSLSVGSVDAGKLSQSYAGHFCERFHPSAISSWKIEILFRCACHYRLPNYVTVLRYSLMDFLTRCASRTADLHPERHDVQEQEAAEDEEADALVEPGVMAAGEPPVDEPVRRGRGRGRGLRRGNRGARAPPPQVNPQVRGRGRRGGARPRDPPLDVPAQLAQLDEPVEEPDARLAVDPDVQILQNEEDIFHLPEDDLPVFPLPEEPVPYHPVDPLPDLDENDNEAIRPAGPCCVVCLVEPRTHAFIPCGHQVCCAACAARLTVRCPFCRTEAIGVFRIRTDV